MQIIKLWIFLCTGNLLSGFCFLPFCISHRYYVAQRRPSKCQEEGTIIKMSEQDCHSCIQHANYLTWSWWSLQETLSHSHKHLIVLIKCHGSEINRDKSVAGFYLHTTTVFGGYLTEMIFFYINSHLSSLVDTMVCMFITKRTQIFASSISYGLHFSYSIWRSVSQFFSIFSLVCFISFIDETLSVLGTLLVAHVVPAGNGLVLVLFNFRSLRLWKAEWNSGIIPP